MLDSGLYFVQDENNIINTLLQVESGFGSGSGGQKSKDPDPHSWKTFHVKLLNWIRIKFSKCRVRPNNVVTITST